MSTIHNLTDSSRIEMYEENCEFFEKQLREYGNVLRVNNLPIGEYEINHLKYLFKKYKIAKVRLSKAKIDFELNPILNNILCGNYI
jgi:hypothetical protein